MATFHDAAEVCRILGGFFRHLANETPLGEELLASKLKLKFRYKQPEIAITIDLSGEKALIEAPAQDDFVADIEMSMSADVAHRFWQGKVNLVLAIAKRDIVAKGPIPKILKLLPVIKPAYEIYPKYFSEQTGQPCST